MSGGGIEGVRRFYLRAATGQGLVIGGLVMRGCTDQQMLGNHFVVPKRAVVSYEDLNKAYDDGNGRVKLRFEYFAADGRWVAAVCLLAQKKL